jgi:outer membrane receptor for ferrienterochelin and colicins
VGVIVGNPDLKPETSINYEVSAQWDNGHNLSAGVTVFNSEFKDKITEIRTVLVIQELEIVHG